MFSSAAAGAADVSFSVFSVALLCWISSGRSGGRRYFPNVCLELQPQFEQGLGIGVIHDLLKLLLVSGGQFVLEHIDDGVGV